MKKIAIMGLISVLAAVSKAETISIVASETDQGANIGVASNAMAFVNQPIVRVGDGSRDIPTVYIVPFKLPVLAEGSKIGDVSLNVCAATKTSFSNGKIYMDVVGLRVSSSPNVLATDPSMTAGTVIGDNVQLINQTVTVPLDGSYALDKSYFQNIYNNDPDAAGKFVFLLLRTDGIDPIAPNSYLQFNTANSATGKPVLNITTVSGTAAKR